MRIRNVLIGLVATAVLAAGATVGVRTFDTWQGWLFPSLPDAAEEEEYASEEPDHIHLSLQARANLRLVVKPIRLETYWRTLLVPGTVVERPGRGHQGVPAPVAGVITGIAAVPGEMVQPGETLFTLRLVSEQLQTTQAELFKTARELLINREQRDRLAESFKSGSVPMVRMIELESQDRRLSAAAQAYRHELKARGLTDEQLQAVEEGRFIQEISIAVPGRTAAGQVAALSPAPDSTAALDDPPTPFEVVELKTRRGEQVQAGQVLCVLADHQILEVEGRAFRHEAPLLERAAQEGWPVRLDVSGESDSWPTAEDLRIRALAGTLDEASQTFPFYLTLPNQWREYQRGDRTYRLWRYRPGQRVRLAVPVELFHDVFVLPADAVVREGPEAYVFRANGDVFERKPVQVLYEDRRNAVLANDGSINVGNHIAQNGAAALQRALKAQAAEGDEGGHHHHHH